MTISTPPGTYSSNEDQSDNGPTGVQSLSESSHHWYQSSVQESSGISPLHVQVPTQSLSVILSQTRSLLSELSEVLNQPKALVKAKGKNQLLEFSPVQNPFYYWLKKNRRKKKRKKLKQREKRRERERERGKTKKRKLRNNRKLKPRKRGKKKQQPRSNLRLNNLMPKPKRYQ